METQVDPVTPRNRIDGLALVGIAIACVALLAAVFGVSLSFGKVDDARRIAAIAGVATETVPVTVSEFKIEPSTVTVGAGGRLQITNGGSTQHNLAVKGTALHTAMIDPAKTATLDLASLAAGDYTIICEVPGHEGSGMTGTLHIGAAGTAETVMPGGAMPGMSHGTSAEQMDAIMAARTKAFPAATKGVGAADLAPKVLADGTKEFDLTTSQVDWEVEPGKIVKAMAYNGIVPGPTLRVEPGDHVRVVLHNKMDQSTVIHFHGIDVPNAMDGVPDITQPPVKPGETFTYDFTPKVPMVGLYHSHHNGQVQVPDGLFGAFYVGHMTLPAGTPKLAQDFPMILNDAGTIGFSLNGKSFPATAPVVAKLGDWIKVDYMNEGLMIHPMHLHGVPQLVIAKDGYPQVPHLEDTILVAPGERFSVLIHATAPGVWAWHCHILTHAEREDGMFGMVTALVVK